MAEILDFRNSPSVTITKGAQTGTDSVSGYPIFPVSFTAVGSTIIADLYFGKASASTTLGIDTITLDSVPIVGSAVVFVNGLYATYAAIGQVLTLDSPVYNGTVAVTWATVNSTPGGITLSNVNIHNPQIRGTGAMASSASGYSLPLPSGTQAGDLAVICGAHGYVLSAPAGWTKVAVTASSWQGAVFYKNLSSADVTAGAVTMTASGSYDGALSIVTFIGATAGIREYPFSGATTTPQSLSTSSAVSSTDTLIYFGSNRGAGVASVNRGTLQQSKTDGANGTCCLSTEIMSASGVVTASFAYTGSVSVGDYQVIVVVKGV